LKKMLNKSEVSSIEFPQILRKYYEKYPEVKKLQSSSQLLYNFYRAMYPWPGIWTLVPIKGQEKRLKITDMELGNNSVTITKVQLEGKNEVDFNMFEAAYDVFHMPT
jgi:methionyl-tRNA formyltransferase